jgi:hypothetical protein
VNRLKFSEDWDKLKEPRFTTIRSHSPEKEAYYRGLVGQTLLLWRTHRPWGWSVHDHSIGRATLLRVTVVRPADLPDEVLMHDVMQGGKPSDRWKLKLYEMPKALLLELENHTGLLAAKGVP